MLVTRRRNRLLILLAAYIAIAPTGRALANELTPPDQLRSIQRTQLTHSASKALRNRLIGSWKITGYHAWDKRHNEYIEIAKRRDPMNKTVETWLFRKNGTFRHIMSKNLWFTGKWEIKEGLGGQTASQSSHDIVLAMDVSGTMRGEPLAGAKRAALELVTKMSATSRVALVTFGSKVEIQGFSSNRQALQKRIRSLDAKAMKTRLYDGLQAALKLAAKGRAGRVTIVLLSDGKDEGSKAQLLDVLGSLEAIKAPVHAIGYTRVEKRYLTALKSFANISNGSFGSADQATKLEPLLRATLKEFIPAKGPGYFVLKTYNVRGSMPNMRRPEDWFIGTWLDQGKDLVIYYVGTRWDLSHRNSLAQASRFESVRYGER